MSVSAQKAVLVAGSGRAAADACAGLLASGYRADRAEDPAAALDRLDANGFALVLVAELPSERAGARLALCAAIRERCGGLPVVLLGAAGSERDAIGRPGGPDDYVVREFDLAEICTRVRLAIERARDRGARSRAGTLASCGPLRLDAGARRVSFGGRQVQLTAIEYQVLTTHVNRLRAKLERELARRGSSRPCAGSAIGSRSRAIASRSLRTDSRQLPQARLRRRAAARPARPRPSSAAVPGSGTGTAMLTRSGLPTTPAAVARPEPRFTVYRSAPLLM